ncbi:YveK family protein [Pontibacillus marinus]|uniref:Capsular polysaccharide biosynthesis protein n=1 Tax=Pontibacillus marinus BH030004 = DSM 16465 TaxID=1385511 RepID=A0A0A5GIP8_9BACI|nr:Wzz/FepE/Etk N-terminal domain-containing protein [Pontibacillus marinus]KGX90985.1 capsular polysaccharide biosynthesis protein [Pontibacillus marinus BH030004 = DSM 16465]
MEETISLKEIFEVLKKRILLIISLIVVATVTSGLISYFYLTPIYESSSQFLVNQKEQEQSMNYNVNDIRTNVELINTYNVIIKSPAILDDVIEEMELDLSNGQLKNKLRVSSEQNSQVVMVTATDPDPNQAAEIANTTVEIFQNKIPTLMNVNNVHILSQAVVGTNPQPVKPQPILNIAIAFVVGAMAGVGLAFLLEYMDNTIKNESDVEQILGVPVLGVISEISEQDLGDYRTTRSKTTTQTSGGESLGA